MSSKFYERLLAMYVVLVCATIVGSLVGAIWDRLSWGDWWRLLVTAVLISVPGILVIGILGSQAEKRERQKEAENLRASLRWKRSTPE